MNKENWIREDGLGEDKLFKTHKNLRCKWRWADIMHTPNSSQVSLAEVYDWELQAIHWHDEYKAEVRYNDKHIISKGGLKTRLETQIQAEKLLFEWLKNEYSEIGKKFKRQREF